MYTGKLAIFKAIETIPLVVVATKLQMNNLCDLLYKSFVQFWDKTNLFDILRTNFKSCDEKREAEILIIKIIIIVIVVVRMMMMVVRMMTWRV